MAAAWLASPSSMSPAAGCGSAAAAADAAAGGGGGGGDLIAEDLEEAPDERVRKGHDEEGK